MNPTKRHQIQKDNAEFARDSARGKSVGTHSTVKPTVPAMLVYLSIRDKSPLTALSLHPLCFVALPAQRGKILWKDVSKLLLGHSPIQLFQFGFRRLSFGRQILDQFGKKCFHRSLCIRYGMRLGMIPPQLHNAGDGMDLCICKPSIRQLQYGVSPNRRTPKSIKAMGVALTNGPPETTDFAYDPLH